MHEDRSRFIDFRCDCGEKVSFHSFGREDERTEVDCGECGRRWRQEHKAEGHWERTLVRGPGAQGGS